MMLGFLLARAGVDVVVLEKHGDFLRDFRGDTIHPSTLEVIRQLGLIDRSGRCCRTRSAGWTWSCPGTGSPRWTSPPCRLPCAFLGLMPQWDFLDFLAAEARRYPTFHLVMQAEVTGLRWDRGRVRGVTARTPDGRAGGERPT